MPVVVVVVDGGRAASHSQSFAGKPLFVSACEKGFLWLRLTDWSGRSELVRRGRCRRGVTASSLVAVAAVSGGALLQCSAGGGEVALPAAGPAIKPTTA